MRAGMISGVNFVDAVDSKTNILKTTKFTYLQCLLRNEALKVISNITLTSDGYDLAVQLLKRNYDNKEKTITILVQKFMALPTANNSTDSLQTFRLELESLLKALSLKVQIQTAEWMTEVVVRRKLLRETLDKLCTMYNKTSLTMNEITEGLHTLVERQRANQDGKSVSNFFTNSHHKPQRTATTVVKPIFNRSSLKWKSGNVGTYTVNPSTPVVSTTPTTSPTMKKCLFCNNEHFTYKCSTYPDHNTRIHRLQELHRCTECTGLHDPNSCTVSLRMCNKCHKGRHHYSLCGSDQSRSTNPHKKITKFTSVQYCKVHQDISVLATESSNTTTLPTAQLKLITKGSRTSTRGLFDQGSQKTFISQQLVDQLKLKPITRVNLNISGFLTNSGPRDYQVVKVLVHLGGSTSPIQAIVVDKIPSDLHVTGLAQTIKFLKRSGIRLADQLARLRKQPDKLQLYHALIQQQLANKFIEVVEEDNHKSGHYLPHHAVLKESVTTPIRIVFNCSAKLKADNVSLNDCLQTGPSLTQRPQNVLLRFRSGVFAYTADISKAFFKSRLTRDGSGFY
ncbi:uncharacterized protein [Procambarus clarkii]|uniref:uncharacterized protein n=1 Tax=Procambarus clarkii TaxID=6728 RepID=UPI0037425D8E